MTQLSNSISGSNQCTNCQTKDITLSNESIESLFYFFTATDFHGNWNKTQKKVINIKDNDEPIIKYDNSSINATTGDLFKFEISISDNIGLSLLYVEYWSDNGSHYNRTLFGSGPYNTTVILPNNISNSLYYRFHALDNSNNHAISEIFNITVLDNDPPCISKEGSDIIGSTGDKFCINISFVDNIELSSIVLDYWFENGSHNKITFNGTNSILYNITIPKNSTSCLKYFLNVSDKAGNYLVTKTTIVNVTDNDPPLLSKDHTPNNATVGNNLTIKVDLYDNIEIKKAWIKYWYGSGNKTKKYLILTGGNYTCNITIKNSLSANLSYIVYANDTSNNSFKSQTKNISLVNSLGKLLSKLKLLETYQNNTFLENSIQLDEGIDIDSVKWSNNGGAGSREPTEPGNYIVKITLKDDEGNTKTITVNLSVLPEDNDKDWDGIPDLDEIDLGLDPEDPDDSTYDDDEDGLTNLQEYKNGTKMNSSDSDGDGIPDGWEVENKLDPLDESDAQNDNDGDGVPNIEEYEKGSNPNLNEEKKRSASSTIIIIIIAVIISIIVISISLIIIKRNTNSNIYVDFDE